MQLAPRVEHLRTCTLLENAISSAATLKTNYERIVEAIPTHGRESLYDTIEAIEAYSMLMQRVYKMLCNGDYGPATLMQAYNLLYTGYERFITSPRLPAKLRIYYYEVLNQLRRLMQVADEKAAGLLP